MPLYRIKQSNIKTPTNNPVKEGKKSTINTKTLSKFYFQALFNIYKCLYCLIVVLLCIKRALTWVFISFLLVAPSIMVNYCIIRNFFVFIPDDKNIIHNKY